MNPAIHEEANRLKKLIDSYRDAIAELRLVSGMTYVEWQILRPKTGDPHHLPEEVRLAMLSAYETGLAELKEQYLKL